MSISSDIFQKMYNSSAIQALVDTMPDGKYAVFHDLVVPETFTGDASINFYRVDPIDNTMVIQEEVYTVNCRAEAFADANTLADAVITLLNRKKSSSTGFCYMSKLPPIRPIDETDNYNVPVEIRVKNKDLT